MRTALWRVDLFELKETLIIHIFQPTGFTLNDPCNTANKTVSPVCQDRRVPINFTAIDFETANSSSASACAVGLVRVREGSIVETAEWLIRPPAEFDRFERFNINLHGINPEMVGDAASWADQLSQLVDFIGSDIVVAHNAGFDMGVIRASCAATVQPTPKFRYLCSVQVSRKTYDLPSHSLPYASAAAGFGEFSHHDALADAEACASIITDSALRNEATSLQALAKQLGVKIAHLKATPLKL